MGQRFDYSLLREGIGRRNLVGVNVHARLKITAWTCKYYVQLFMRLHSEGLYKESVLETHRQWLLRQSIIDCRNNHCLYVSIHSEKGGGRGRCLIGCVWDSEYTQVCVRMHATFSDNGWLHAELQLVCLLLRGWIVAILRIMDCGIVSECFCEHVSRDRMGLLRWWLMYLQNSDGGSFPSIIVHDMKLHHSH